MGGKFFEKNDVKLIVLAIAGGLLPMALPPVSEFFSVLLQSFSLSFSQWTASLFSGFVICPYKIIFESPSIIHLVIVCVALVVCFFCYFAFIGITIDGVKVSAWKVRPIVSVVFCLFAFILIFTWLSFVRFDTAKQLYEKYCKADFQVSEFCEAEAIKFKRRITVAETITDIDAILLEMAEYVKEQFRNQDTKTTAETSPDDD